MKKLLLTTTATGAALAIAMPAQADNYLSIFGGLSMMDDHSQRVFEASGLMSSSTSRTTGLTNISSMSQTMGSYSSIQYVSQFTQVTTTTSGTYFSATDVDLSVDTGFVIGAAMGKDMGDGLSMEVELAYRKHNVDMAGLFSSSTSYTGNRYSQLYSLTFTHVTYVSVSATVTFTTSASFGTTSSPATSAVTTPLSGTGAFTSTFADSGDWSAFSIMANVWYELGGDMGGAHPYIGGGLGWANVDFESGGLSASDTGFAYQVAAGVGWDMPQNGGRMSVEYRYFSAGDLEFDVGGTSDLAYDYGASEILVKFSMPM